MKLSEIPFEAVQLGIKVKSAVGVLGFVSQKHSAKSLGYGEDFLDKHEIEITWNNGEISKFWHVWSDKIEVAE